MGSFKYMLICQHTVSGARAGDWETLARLFSATIHPSGTHGLPAVSHLPAYVLVRKQHLPSSLLHQEIILGRKMSSFSSISALDNLGNSIAGSRVSKQVKGKLSRVGHKLIKGFFRAILGHRLRHCGVHAREGMRKGRERSTRPQAFPAPLWLLLTWLGQVLLWLCK